MSRSDLTIAAGPSPYANEDETLKAALLRNGYTIAPASGQWGYGSVNVIRDGRVRFCSPTVRQTTAWLIRRNRKLAALRGAK